MARETDVAKKIIEAKITLLSPKHSFLSIFLLKEKYDPVSEWHPYIDILPTDYLNFPVLFSDEDLAWLKGSPFLSNQYYFYQSICFPLILISFLRLSSRKKSRHQT